MWNVKYLCKYQNSTGLNCQSRASVTCPTSTKSNPRVESLGGKKSWRLESFRTSAYLRSCWHSGLSFFSAWFFCLIFELDFQAWYFCLIFFCAFFNTVAFGFILPQFNSIRLNFMLATKLKLCKNPFRQQKKDANLRRKKENFFFFLFSLYFPTIDFNAIDYILYNLPVTTCIIMQNEI